MADPPNALVQLLDVFLLHLGDELVGRMFVKRVAASATSIPLSRLSGSSWPVVRTEAGF